MAKVSTTDFRVGLKLEIDNQPYSIITNEFVKPGKGNAINRVKMRNLVTGNVIEITYKSGDKVDVADIVENKMRMLYKEGEDVVFMDETTYDQIHIPLSHVGDNERWLLEDHLYDILFYKGSAINVEPPTFMDLKITDTAPGDRGNTASGRVLKPAVLETGAKIQVPIFVAQDELVKVDTRTGEYVSRSSK